MQKIEVWQVWYNFNYAVRVVGVLPKYVIYRYDDIGWRQAMVSTKSAFRKKYKFSK